MRSNLKCRDSGKRITRGLEVVGESVSGPQFGERKESTQGLKPDLFWGGYGPTEVGP